MPNAPTSRPQPIPLRLQLSSTLVRAPIFLLGTALFGSASLLTSLFDQNGRRQHRIAQAWARCSMFFAGAPIQTVGREHLLKGLVAVYACNHLSYMDTPAIFSTLPFQFRIVARHDLWRIPFIGWHLKRSGQLPVNVDNPRASIASLSSGVKTLRAGMPLFIFPEGGRTRTGMPTPFLNGPAYMAIRAGVPIVPMALIGTYELLPIGSAVLLPTRILLAIGEPIPTAELTPRDVDRLTETLSKRVSDLYFTYSGCSGPAEPSNYDGTMDGSM